jgi:RNA polymerase sigma-70 factor (ECF subfamily)
MNHASLERFTTLYDTHHGRVYAYVVSRAGRQIADEVVNETFLIAWRRFDEVPEQVLPWLFGVARNVLHEQYRRSLREESLARELRSATTAADFTIADVAESVTERSAVLQALLTLAEADREVLTLAAWHGLSSSEAARVVGCSRSAYCVRLHRARHRLKQAIHTHQTANAAEDVALLSACGPELGEEPSR